MSDTPRRPTPRTARRAALLAVAAVIALTVSVVPHAGLAAPADRSSKAPTATVRVAEGFYPVTGDAGPYVATTEPCPVRLARRGLTTALDALEAARQERCVSSYVVEETDAGPYLRCVNGRCEDLGFYWAVYRNRTLTCEGIGDVVLAAGDELTLSYETYPTALALASCA